MMKTRLLVLTGLLLVSACDLTPVYGTHGVSEGSPVAAALNTIEIDNIPDRDGQVLRNNLIDRLYSKNRPSHPAYKLKITLHPSEENLGILANATATRALLNMEADYTLLDNNDNEVLHGTAHSVASFNLLDQIYGTVAARQGAHERTLHEISEQITNRLSLYFAEHQ